jgi:hypothetical protein
MGQKSTGSWTQIRNTGCSPSGQIQVKNKFSYTKEGYLVAIVMNGSLKKIRKQIIRMEQKQKGSAKKLKV